MKKVFIACLIFISLGVYGSYLEFNPHSGDFSFSSEHIFFSSESSSFLFDYGILKAGFITENSSIGLLFDPFSLKWKGMGRRVRVSGRGFSLNDKDLSYFILLKPVFSHGISYETNDFSFAIAYAGEGEVKEDVIMLHEERGGFESFHMLLSYDPSFMLLRTKFSYSEEIGFKGMFSIGLSFYGLALSFSDGRVENLSGKPSEVRRLDLSIDGDSVDYKAYLAYHSEPLDAGSFRSYEAKEIIALDLGALTLEGEHESSFSSKGNIRSKAAFVLSFGSFSIGFDNTLSPILRFDNNSWNFSYEENAFSFAYRIKEERYSIILGADSRGSIRSEFKLLL